MKFATIGTSWITELFIKSVHQTKKASLFSVYSRSKETAIQFSQKNGAQNWYTNIDKMLEDPIDFVYIASPNELHYEHIVQCIEKKKHVFCEKPLIYTEKQWEDINRKAQKEKVFIFEGYRHLFTPNFQILKNYVNEIGKVRGAIFHFIQYSSRYDALNKGETPNVFSKAFAGGSLMDLGVYPLSAAIDLFGEPSDIDYFPTLLSNGIDGNGTVVLTYKDFNITILHSKISQANSPSEIHGEKGTLTIDHIAQIQSLLYFDRRQDSQIQLAKPQHELDMIYQIEVFTQMVEKNDFESHNNWLERSRLVAKWTEKARKKTGILFPQDEL